MDILITGVGGQGTLLASRVLGKYALDNEYTGCHSAAEASSLSCVSATILPLL